jgi:hypothetical protein
VLYCLALITWHVRERGLSANSWGPTSSVLLACLPSNSHHGKRLFSAAAKELASVNCTRRNRGSCVGYV